MAVQEAAVAAPAVSAEVAEALACPCVAELRDGVCGAAFVTAFSCYVSSREKEKGTECAELFEHMRVCMETHNDQFQSLYEAAAAETAVEAPTTAETGSRQTA